MNLVVYKIQSLTWEKVFYFYFYFLIVIYLVNNSNLSLSLSLTIKEIKFKHYNEYEAMF